MTAAREAMTDTPTGVPGGLRWWFSDALVMVERSLIHIRRSPQIMLYWVVQPIVFLLLFVYVFGGAIQLPGAGGDYLQFVVPGVFAQAVLINSVGGATVGFATDMQQGILDRFRSLPMSRSSVPVGRIVSELLRNMVTLVILLVGSLLLGFRFGGGLGEIVLAFGLLLAFGFAFSWLAALIGLAAGSPEAAQGIGFIWLPFVFVSSVFVPAETMPGWLQVYVVHSPISVTADAMRSLFSGTPDAGLIWGSALWSLVLVLVFVPLSLAKYRS